LGPHRNGVSSWKGPITGKTGGSNERWRRPVGAGYSGPVVSGDSLVLFHQPENEELIECLDPATGKTRWQTGYPCSYQGGYGTGPGPRATPSISGDRVVSFGVTGVLQCLELSTGNVLWRRDLGKEYSLPETFFGIGTSPLVQGDRVLLNLGSKEEAGLAAFDLASGETVWAATDDTASYSSPVVRSVHGEELAFFFARSGLHCVEAKSGKERFFFPFRARMHASVNAATPIVEGNQVFLTSSYGVGAALLEVKPERGFAKIWTSDDVMSSQYNTPVYRDGYLYGIDGREDLGVARLVCVEWKTGKLAWAEDGFGCASIVLVGDDLLLLTQNGELVIAPADPMNFQPRIRAKILSSPCRAEPAVAGGRLYARDEANLIAVDLTSK
jgi:outer membrane protein assembly factor BamB